MPFLLPALGSLICDGTILYLLTFSSLNPDMDHNRKDDQDHNSRMGKDFEGTGTLFFSCVVVVRFGLLLIF